MIFSNRKEAGRLLAERLHQYDHQPDTIVLGLPRGGVITAFEVAMALKLPLDIVCARKIGSPYNPELAIGAITDSGEGYFNEALIAALNVDQAYIDTEVAKESKEAMRRAIVYRQNRPKINLEGKTVILIDDGLATGATMKASIQAVKADGADAVIVALPVAPFDIFEEIKDSVNSAIALETPVDFYAVGEFYDEFTQTTDQEVIDLMALSYKTGGR